MCRSAVTAPVHPTIAAIAENASMALLSSGPTTINVSPRRTSPSPGPTVVSSAVDASSPESSEPSSSRKSKPSNALNRPPRNDQAII